MIVKTNREEFQRYLRDAANFHGNCHAVYFPETEKDVIDIIRSAYLSDESVTLSGANTGLTGSGVPESGIVIATDKMNRIYSIDAEKKIVDLQPGVILADLQTELLNRGLYYPPDPTETNCFIGGNIATNASGAKSFKYGATRNFVESLEIILATGEKLKISRGEFTAENFRLKVKTESGQEIALKLPEYKMPETKNAAGYFTKSNADVIDVFVGSEGTLGMVTGIRLRVLDYPENILSAVLFFNSEDEALDFNAEARDKSYEYNNKNFPGGISARGLEFFDRGSLIFLASDYPNIPIGVDAAVWLEQETEAQNRDAVFDSWIKLAERHNADLSNSWIAFDEKDRLKFKNFRHSISQKVTEYITSHSVRKVGTDTAVPHNLFKEFYRWSKNLVRSAGIKFINYGHFGDSHMHLNMLPANDSEFAKAKELYAEICRKAVSFSGTISAEHGIGKLKRDYLLQMYGEDAIKQMAALKYAFDRKGILCRGNIFDEKYIITK